MVLITRKEYFNAAHKLWNPDWSADKNKEVFGKCANENWHGHNYELHVTVKGVPEAETGYVMDLKELSNIIKAKVCEKLDHKNLNLDVDFLKGKMTSTENLVVAIWDQIVSAVKADNRQLHRVRLFETNNNYVDYFGSE